MIRARTVKARTARGRVRAREKARVKVRARTGTTRISKVSFIRRVILPLGCRRPEHRSPALIMNPDARLLRNPHVALAPTEDGYLAYDAAHHRLHRLNPAAALIVELCDGARTAEAILADVAPFVADEAGGGCARWIEHALEDHLLEGVEVGAPLPAAPPPDYFSTLASRLRRKGSV